MPSMPFNQPWVVHDMQEADSPKHSVACANITAKPNIAPTMSFAMEEAKEVRLCLQ